MPPHFYITKAHPGTIGHMRNNGFAFFHFACHIIRAAFGDTGTPRLCRRFHFICYGLSIMGIATIRYTNNNLIFQLVMINKSVKRITPACLYRSGRISTDRGNCQLLVLSETTSRSRQADSYRFTWKKGGAEPGVDMDQSLFH